MPLAVSPELCPRRAQPPGSNPNEQIAQINSLKQFFLTSYKWNTHLRICHKR